MLPKAIDVDSREYPPKTFDRVVMPVLMNGSFGNAVMVVWAVEPVAEHKLRAFLRPIKESER